MEDSNSTEVLNVNPPLGMLSSPTTRSALEHNSFNATARSKRVASMRAQSEGSRSNRAGKEAGARQADGNSMAVSCQASSICFETSL